MSRLLTIRVTAEVAKEISHGLSDIACWARGYVCALPPDDRSTYSPIGIEDVREMNIILKGAISDHEKGIDPTEDVMADLTGIASRVCEAAREREDQTAYQVAAYLHDQIVNIRRKLRGGEPLDDAQPWPFGETQ